MGENMIVDDIKRTYQLLSHLEQTEIRLPPLKPIFVSSEEEFLKTVKEYNGTRQVYVGLNERIKGGTKKHEVKNLSIILIDIDPDRPKDTSSTDEQVEEAKKIGYSILDWFDKNYGVKPSLAMSGNGVQIWIKMSPIVLEESNRDSVEDTCKLFGANIKQLFQKKGFKFDSVQDLPRICKVVGVLSMKGEHHRVSHWLHYTTDRNDKLREEIITNSLEKVIIDKNIAVVNEDKEKDMSRSGKEFGELCRLIKKYDKRGEPPDKDWIFNEMNFFSKWKDAPLQYKEHTWNNVLKKIKNEENKDDIEDDFVHAVKDEEKEEYLVKVRERLSKGKWLMKAAEIIIQKNPIYYDKMMTWWLWNKESCSWEEKDETDIINLCRETLKIIGDTTVKHGVKIIEALRQLGREQNPREPPLEYLQFGKQFYNLITGEIIDSTPQYFSTNTIPWTVGEKSDTPVMDELITSWVGKENLQSVYEIIAYCCYRNYPIHRIFCFVGTGANGKTRLMKIIEKFIGEKNESSVTLKKVSNNDFALYPLYRKLVCFVGETAHHRLESTEVLKALSGQDPVSFEAKGKNAFSGINYAKLIVGTNVLPPSTDNSRGWYRRWYILTFPNEFTEGEDVLARIPDAEYEALARKTIEILPVLLKRGNFLTEGTIEERRDNYIRISNPIKLFLEMNYEREVNSDIRFTEIYLSYLNFLSERKLRRISKKEFTAILEDEGLETDRKNVLDPLTGVYNKPFFVLGLLKLPEQKTLSRLDSLNSRMFLLACQNQEKTENSIEANLKSVSIETIATSARLNDVSSRDVINLFMDDSSKCYKYVELVNLFMNRNIDIAIEELLRKGDIMEEPSGTFRKVI